MITTLRLAQTLKWKISEGITTVAPNETPDVWKIAASAEAARHERRSGEKTRRAGFEHATSAMTTRIFAARPGRWRRFESRCGFREVGGGRRRRGDDLANHRGGEERGVGGVNTKAWEKEGDARSARDGKDEREADEENFRRSVTENI